MPYKKRYVRRGRRRRINYPKGKKLVVGHGPTMLDRIASGVGSAARLATAIAPMIASINTESKYFDTNQGATPLLGTLQVLPLSNIAQGTTDTTRIGNSILAKNISIKYQITPNYTGLLYNPIRMLLIVDKMQNGSTPAMADIFETTTTYLSPLNKDYSDRFVVLKDKLIMTNQNGNQAVHGKFFKKLDFHIRYKGISGGVSDQAPNALYLLWWYAAAINGPTCNIYSRLNFTDN